ncbi:hypothetical protein PR048_010846 [Dryococelus australis]|uniref:PiggyBac transposable element-derived protein domain-containing protein n=1 Tax=Dryococelus australis TaxID=614101 RepID=A0ABQ9I3U3_9NEOP|nr:hypothetical protein PR048_010846 [Dryococelus australis]
MQCQGIVLKLLWYLPHGNDNTSVPHGNKDKIYKLRPVVNKLNDRFQQVYKGTRELSIDESIILFKGRSTLKQYNPMNPIKRDYKLWAMADQRGYTLAFKVYQEKGELAETKFQGYGLGERVVLELLKHVWGSFKELYFDNNFLCSHFLRDLQQKNTTRLWNDTSSKDSTDDKKFDRGESDFRFTNTDVGYFKWNDTKRVHLVSNSHGSEIITVKIKGRNGNSYNVGCPTVVSDYNQHVGGVDHADRLRQPYYVDRKSWKWWHRLFWGMCCIAFVNAFVVYKDISVLEFRSSVSQGLITHQALKAKRRCPNDCGASSGTMNVKRRKSNFSVPKDVRITDCGIHWPVFDSRHGRCEVPKISSLDLFLSAPIANFFVHE